LALSQDAPPRRSTGRPRRARVLLHEVQSFDRHEELVVAGVPQLEKFLERVADADLLQTDERADPMIDVNDEIADLQITQIRKKRLVADFRRSGARRSSSKTSASA